MGRRTPESQLGAVFRAQLGKKGDPLSPIYNSLAANGLTLHPITISILRHTPDDQRGRGAILGKQFIANEASGQTEDKISGIKLDLYGRIAQTGLELRQPQPMVPGRFVSLGFTRQVADSIGMDEELVHRLRNAMRIEAIYAAKEDTLPPTLQEIFQESVNTYLRTFSLAIRGTKPEAYRKIATEWNREPTIERFYSSIKKHLSTRSFGTWSPYEAEFMQAFFADVRTKPTLSTLDKKILDAYTKAWKGKKDIEKKLKEAAEGIQEETGISFNYHALHDVLNILVNAQARLHLPDEQTNM